MKSRQQHEGNVTGGMYAGEGIPALILNTLVVQNPWVRSGIQLTTKKEVIGSRQGPALAGVTDNRKSSHPLQLFHDALNNIADWFHRSSPIHAAPTGIPERGQLATGIQLMSCWAMVPLAVCSSHFFLAEAESLLAKIAAKKGAK